MCVVCCRRRVQFDARTRSGSLLVLSRSELHGESSETSHLPLQGDTVHGALVATYVHTCMLEAGRCSGPSHPHPTAIIREAALFAWRVLVPSYVLSRYFQIAGRRAVVSRAETFVQERFASIKIASKFH